MTKKKKKSKSVKNPTGSPTKWKSKLLFKIYDMCRHGYSDSDIAKFLKVSPSTFQNWKKAHPEISDAQKVAKELYQSRLINGSLTFREYLFRILPKKARKTWKRLNKLERAGSSMQRIDAMLDKKGKSVRQYLFIYTWMASNFNLSMAMKKLNVSKSMFENWRRNDPEFADLVDEVVFHKKNFFENSLLDLVAQGDSSAILFVNRTANRDRGYSEKMDVNVLDSSRQNLLPLEEIGLSLEDKKKLLEHIREFKNRKQVESTQLPEKKETEASFEKANNGQ